MNKEKNNGINKDESIDSEKENPEELESEEESPSLEEEIESLKDQVLRAKAEVQNVRRVAEQEVRKARLYGVESLAKNFLSVGDNLERAIESLNDDSKPEDLEEGLWISGIPGTVDLVVKGHGFVEDGQMILDSKSN